MNTKVLKIDEIEIAAKALKEGKIVAIPTETVYGLAASMYDEAAIKAIFIAKGRPMDNPLIVHVCSLEQVSEIALEIPKDALLLAKTFWPGPLTMILKKKPNVSKSITAGLETVAVRFPSHKAAQKIIEDTGVPLVAPSANLSGKPSTTSAKDCIEDLTGRVPFIVDAGDSEIGLESTIIDMTVTPATILRPGGITVEEIAKIIPDVNYVETIHLGEKETPKAPGMKYRHYAPNAPVTLVTGEYVLTAKWIFEKAGKQDGVLVLKEYLELFQKNHCIELNHKTLFASLRKFDEMKVSHIYVQCPENKDIGTAMFNRLKKASGNNIITIDKT